MTTISNLLPAQLNSSSYRAIQEKKNPTKNRGLFPTSFSAHNLFYDAYVKKEWQALMATVSDKYDTFYELQPAQQTSMWLMTGKPWPRFTSLSIISAGMHSISL